MTRRIAYIKVELAIFVDEDDEDHVFTKEVLSDRASYEHLELTVLGVETTAHVTDVEEVVMDVARV